MFLDKMLFALLIVHLFLVSYSESVDNNSSFSSALNGEELVKLGRKLHKPLLTLIGMTLHNLHPCDDWTPWSSCSEPRIGYFGSRTRSRKCDYTQNTVGIRNATETDNKLCEGFCPIGYNVTEHGYCIRFYNAVVLSNDDAHKQCEDDGGNLINMESQQKYDDVKQIIDGYSGRIIVGGKRKDVSSPWEYQYGSRTGFIIWRTGQPGNGSSELCLMLNQSRLWHDIPCTEKLAFLCEIISE